MTALRDQSLGQLDELLSQVSIIAMRHGHNVVHTEVVELLLSLFEKKCTRTGPHRVNPKKAKNHLKLAGKSTRDHFENLDGSQNTNENNKKEESLKLDYGEKEIY